MTEYLLKRSNFYSMREYSLRGNVHRKAKFRPLITESLLRACLYFLLVWLLTPDPGFSSISVAPMVHITV